ncbi:GNAT family N-acetyltransferase [Brevibacillus dissolubilis]|uniref:GNAT family N-acetyltransferase n=1 Tax=Brevibacillus dissolubilis TaxID=1844116 RepID=UPI001115FD8E|nr:GNAT family protein [Brevibacillus dissolubilis]
MLAAKNLLTGERIRLTALTTDDVPVMVTWYSDEYVLRHLDATPAKPYTAEKLTKWLEQNNSSDTSYVFAIRTLDENLLIGYIALTAILWNNRVSWIEMLIGGEETRGKGYGTEALQVAIGFAFRELNLHRIQLSVFDYNIPGIRAYEKAGFKREGTYREFLHRDGQVFDMHLYGLLRHEWEQG